MKRKMTENVIYSDKDYIVLGVLGYLDEIKRWEVTAVEILEYIKEVFSTTDMDEVECFTILGQLAKDNLVDVEKQYNIPLYTITTDGYSEMFENPDFYFKITEFYKE